MSPFVPLAAGNGGVDRGKFQVVVRCFSLTQNLLGSLLQRNVFDDLDQIFGTKTS